MSLTVSIVLVALGASLIYKGWRGLSWQEFYQSIATERTGG